jgi:glucose-1-phosphate thymidylyltransferase
MSEVIGLIPAAGRAERISPLPCSKELYPVGFWRCPGKKEGRPKVACHYLLEKMRIAGITRAYIVLRQGKWDIPAYLQDGAMADMHLAYLMLGLPYGVPYTLDQAYPFVRDTIIAFGFPDILFKPDDTFVRLIAEHEGSKSDITLGLFPADSPRNVDMVKLDENSRIREVFIKPEHTKLRLTWGVAVWSPLFTSFLHEYLASLKGSRAVKPELSMGHIIKAAVARGLKVEGISVSEDPYLDIGTPKNLLKAIRNIQ